MRDISSVRANSIQTFALSDLDEKQQSSVQDMMVGNRTCSLENMTTSCFASERCNRCPTAKNTGHMSIESLLHGSLATYALLRDGREVLAVATTRPMKQCGLTMRPPAPQTGVLLSNLCVRNTERSNGIGKHILNHVYDDMPDEDIYVTVVLPTANATDDVHSFMKARSSALLDTYRRLNFTRVATTPEYVVLVHPHNSRTRNRRERGEHCASE